MNKTLPVNAQLIRKKTVEISKCLSITGFLASEGLFNKFKPRNKLRFMPTRGTVVFVNHNTTSDKRQKKHPKILRISDLKTYTMLVKQVCILNYCQTSLFVSQLLWKVSYI
ncbi:hypothetical protein CDIK_1598 [Cucumispora dikerogammari]|nr:hypothetical protein CDIK_1598 [Cucumispora dikerogammari]